MRLTAEVRGCGGFIGRSLFGIRSHAFAGKPRHADDDDDDETMQGTFYHVAGVELNMVKVPCRVHVVGTCHVAGL